MPAAPPRPIRVLYIMHNASPAGSSESLRCLVDHFPTGTVLATILCPDGPVVSRLRETGAVVRLIGGVSMLHSIAGVPLRGRRLLELGRTAWMMRYGRQIRAAIREIRPDLVHLNERGMLQAVWIAHKEGVPMVLHARSVADRRPSWLRQASRAIIRRYVGRVIAIDESVRQSLGDLSNVEVIYNPLDVRSIPSLPKSSSVSIRGEGQPVRVTYLTGLLAFKGIWDLLESARLLRDRNDIVFQVAGANSRPAEFHHSWQGRLSRLVGFTPDVEASVRGWVKRVGLEGTVRLLGQVQPVEMLGETDILVFPSHLNGPGRSIFEAGVQGIPSVLSLRDRVEDVVVDGETGLIVPERDPQSLAQAIERLTDDPALRRRLGQNAKARYKHQFAPEPIAEQVLTLYKRLLNRVNRDPSSPTTEDRVPTRASVG